MGPVLVLAVRLARMDIVRPCLDVALIGRLFCCLCSWRAVGRRGNAGAIGAGLRTGSSRPASRLSCRSGLLTITGSRLRLPAGLGLLYACRSLIATLSLTVAILIVIGTSRYLTSTGPRLSRGLRLARVAF